MKSMFLPVIWWCPHSFEDLNSTPGAYRPRPAIQLHCPSKKQHLHVVMTKAISGNHPEDPKVSTSAHRKQLVVQLFKFPRIAKHCSSPATRLFLSILTALTWTSSSLSTYWIPVLTLHELAGCAPCMPYQKTTARTILVLWSALGFPPKAIAALQITRVSTALPRALHIWKSRYNKLDLLFCKLALQRSWIYCCKLRSHRENNFLNSGRNIMLRRFQLFVSNNISPCGSGRDLSTIIQNTKRTMQI